MAEVNLNLEADPGVKLLLSQLRRDPPGMPTDNRLNQSLKNTGVPYLAISAIGNALAGSTIRVKIRDKNVAPPGTSTVVKSQSANQQHKDDELRDAPASHPLCRLFDYINPNDTFEDLIMDMTLQYCLTGTAPFFIVPSRLNTPCEMYVLQTALMLAQPPSPNYPEGAWRVQQYQAAGMYGLTPASQAQIGVLVDARYIKRFRMRHPLIRWDGYSPLTAGGVQLDVLNAIDESRKSAMDHGFNPDAVITVAGANAESLQRLKADMENKHGGSRNARKVLFSNGQSLDVETLSTNPKEMDYGSGWDQMVKYALALFGVPPGTAGIAEATSYAQLYASLRQFYSLRLQPLAKNLGSFLTKHVAKDVDPDAVIQIDVPDIDDKEFEKSKWDSAAQNNAVTLNEYRGYMSLPAMPDGERLIGDPSAAQQAAEAAQQPEEPQTPEDTVAHSVLGMLGVDPNEAGDDSGLPGGKPDVQKAMVGKFDENKHKRNHGKFSSSAGSGGSANGMRKPVGTGPDNSGKTGVAKRPGMRRNDALEEAMGMPTVASRDRMAATNPAAKPIPVAGLIGHFNKLDSASSDATAWKKGIKFPPAAVSQVRQKLAGMDTTAMTQSHQWAVDAAKKYSGIVGAKLGKDPAKCERALFHMFQAMAQAATLSGQNVSSKLGGVGTFRLKRKEQQTTPKPEAYAGRRDLSALFKSAPELVEIFKGL